MQAPRRTVAAEELALLKDRDARENYEIVLRFRDRLLAAGTLESCYANLFKGNVDVPPLFIEQMVHVVLRNILDGCADTLALRAGELLFREQKATIQEGHVLLADREMVEMHASGAQYGNLGRLIVEAQGATGTVNLDVLERANAGAYWERDSRHDMVISLTYGRPALDGLCRVMEAWIFHFLNIKVRIAPIRNIEEPRWAWHVGLDAEATAILNSLWSGEEVDAGRMRRVLALFRLDFDNPAEMRKDIAGRSVYLGLASDENGTVKLKPQNLILNLPLPAAE